MGISMSMPSLYQRNAKFCSQSLIFAFVFIISLFCYGVGWAKSTDNIVPTNLIGFERLAGGQYVIDVSVNAQGPFKFMIDTGASRTSIFEKTQARLGIKNLNNSKRIVNGMNGAALRPVVIANSISFAGHRVSNHAIIVLEDWGKVGSEHLAGILGMDVLDGLVLSFRHGTGEVQIEAGKDLNWRTYRRWTKINLNLTPNPYPEAEYGLLFTHTLFGGLRIPTMLDTGAGFSAISWDIVEGTKLGKEKKRLREKWVIQGAIGEFKPALRFVMRNMIVGGLEFGKRDLVVLNFDQLPINGYGKYPLAVVGVDLFAGHDFILDLNKGDVLIDAKLKKFRERSRSQARSQVGLYSVVVE